MKEEYCDEHKMLMNSLKRLEEAQQELRYSVDKISSSVSSLPWKVTGAVGGLAIIVQGVLKIIQ